MSYQYGNSYRDRPRGDGLDKTGSFNRRFANNREDYDPYSANYSNGGNRYQSTPPPQQAQGPKLSASGASDSKASGQIVEVLEHIKSEWPSMCENECVPVQMALQLLDPSSVGRAHEYRKFQKSHRYLQESLKNIVHEHHQGFNSSIGTYYKIQSCIQASQKRVRMLKDSLAASKAALCTTDPELKKLHNASEMYEGLLQTLSELEELRMVPDQHEARISEKRFLNAVDVLQNALRKMRKTELDKIGALADLRSYLVNQEGALMEILVEELHNHLYLKSPYCQERWNALAKANKGQEEITTASSAFVVPFQQLLDNMDFDKPVSEDPSKNPEADTFYYITLLVEALNKLGRLEAAVDMLKQRLPVELFAIVNDTVLDMEQKHPASMRALATDSSQRPLALFDDRETQTKRDVINDLLGTLYAKFEAIAEGHRVFHDAIKSLIRREGAGNNTVLLGSFKELWNLYQNELRSLLHDYVTTEADVYQNGPRAGAGAGPGAQSENLFRFAEADPKSAVMLVEIESLDAIIQAAVPGLTSQSPVAANGRGGVRAGLGDAMNHSNINTRRIAASSAHSAYSQKDSGAVKALVEPSVFNMSLLLPWTLGFLQRLKSIVPPGSDLATSTLTSFLDNILVNVFQPQVDETLAKHCNDIYNSNESFLPDPRWKVVAKKPIFVGTSNFFSIISAFCRMLGTIPHDQALSTLIISQLHRYYDRCNEWFKGITSHGQAAAGVNCVQFKYPAHIISERGEIRDIMVRLLTAASQQPDQQDLLEKEVHFFVTQARDELRGEENLIKSPDPVKDRETIVALCLLHTSMKWLAVQVKSLRHITRTETDSNRHSKPTSKRWAELDGMHRIKNVQGPVYLPMTEETVSSFDQILQSYEDLATQALLTLHSEERCRVVHSLHTTLSRKKAYLLDQEVSDPDLAIMGLNEDLAVYDEVTTQHLREPEACFMRAGLGRLVRTYLIANASVVSPMNAMGCRRMELNILVLQQNLKNIEPGVDLVRAADYFAMFHRGPNAIIELAKYSSASAAAGAGAAASIAEADGDAGTLWRQRMRRHNFTYDELKTMVELCFSEQLASPERGIATAAKRQMGDRLLTLTEYAWQN